MLNSGEKISLPIAVSYGQPLTSLTAISLIPFPTHIQKGWLSRDLLIGRVWNIASDEKSKSMEAFFACFNVHVPLII